jgi:hypothetical protein
MVGNYMNKNRYTTNTKLFSVFINISVDNGLNRGTINALGKRTIDSPEIFDVLS